MYILKACLRYTNSRCVFVHSCAHVHFFMCSISSTVVCIAVVTHQVHSGGGVTQGHADPGGCVSDDLMIHVLQSDFILFFVPDGPLRALFDWPRAAGCCCAVLTAALEL